MKSIDTQIFEQTCSLLDGELALPSCFKALIDWIEAHEEVDVANILYQVVPVVCAGERPHLKLVLRSEADRQKLCGSTGQLSRKCQRSIREVLSTILRQMGIRSKCSLSQLYVTVETLSGLGVINAKRSFTRRDEAHMMQRLSRYGVVGLKHYFETTVMIFNDQQSDEGQRLENEFHVRRVYFDYLKFYDERDCFSPSDLKLSFVRREVETTPDEVCMHY
ncbi:hypothetical protein [Coraliomargarita akajimensis]|uniref:Uncharacterized protein n=1 Tax=Coraliomargarita akajimensis (strain DSM 45221 / IAM 15411 / JCM 23193 / KCTC 12865 / 04OKA010-24) TaxID=583355 RepID=D5EJ45_CORAD|nr:hypothetical protein [Coraliomargarita akajimensis]ADE54444.1 hypothetical protein Caka_1425 [Coraliomargarita akajimensis DSM 45221]